MKVFFLFQVTNQNESSISSNYFSFYTNKTICKRCYKIAGLIFILLFCLVLRSYAECVTKGICETQDSSFMGITTAKDSISNMPYLLFNQDESKELFPFPASNTYELFNANIRKKEENQDWSKYSFWATTVGALMTVFSIFAMYLIFRSDNKGAKEQLYLLKKQINNSNIQIRNQKNSLLTLTKNNLTVVNEMKKSVFTIQDHMVNKDIYLRIIEHKQAIKSSFSLLLKNHLMRQGFNLAEGTVMQDEQVNKMVGAILEHIAIIDGLLNNKSSDYSEQKMLCESDMNGLFGRRSKHNDDVANWIIDVRNHFYNFDQMLGQVIKEVKTQNNLNGH